MMVTATRMVVAALPLWTTTAMALTARSALTCTASVTTGASLSPSVSPSLTTPTLWCGYQAKAFQV